MSKSDDTISRQDAIDVVGYEIDDWYNAMVDRIKELPTRITEYKTFCGVPIKEAARIVREHNADKPKTDEENELKFYYVESIDDYWIGQRLDNFYYADWHDGLGFVWSHSRYLPWGEYIVDENTLWKEHTYPSEPIEMPFTQWIIGFMKKYSVQPKTGRWKLVDHLWQCDQCQYRQNEMAPTNFCPSCGSKMEWR